MTEPGVDRPPFILDRAYRNFVPGKTRLKFKTLSVLNGDEFTASMLMMVFMAIPVLFMLMFVVYDIGNSVLFQFFSRPVTVTVSGCVMRSYGENEKEPELRYYYLVDGNMYLARDSNWPGTCDAYPNGLTLAALYLEPDPARSNLIHPETGQIDSTSPGLLVLVLPLMLMMGFCLVLMRRMVRDMVRYVQARFTYPRLSKTGTLLDGEIVSVREQEHYLGGRRYGDTKRYCLIVQYTFKTPRKRRLTGWMKAIRPEMKGKTLPAAGTPVMILYADDNAHVML